MNITIATATDNDQNAWDEFVAQHPYSSPYHRYAWGQAVKTAYGFETHNLIATDNGAVIGVLPMVKLTRPLSGARYCALPYCDLGGPLANSTEVASALITAAVNHAKQSNIHSVQFRQLAEGEQAEDKLIGQKVSMRLPLPDTSEALLTSFKSKLRSQIRKAEKNGLTYKTGLSSDLLNDFYDVMLVNMRALGSPVHSLEWFRQVMNRYGEHCLLSVVYKDDIAVGGGLIIKSGTTASIPWASTKADFNRLAPNMLLYWSLLAHCADNNIETFDFGRSTYGEGTYKFKTQWGAKPKLLEWHQYQQGQLVQPAPTTNSTGTHSKLNVMVKSWAVSGWQRLPLGMTGSIGPRLRKYIDL